MPASSLSQLLRELSWQEGEHYLGPGRKASKSPGRGVSATSILREYCGVGAEKESGCPPCTPSARYKLHARKAEPEV